MDHAALPFEYPRELLSALKIHRKLWLLPAVMIALVTAGYAVFKNDVWEASQALIVRNEASNNERGPGKFAQVEEMKTVQETLLELSRSRGVLEAALKEVGPPAKQSGWLQSLFSGGEGDSRIFAAQKLGQSPWPTAREIEKFRKHVKLEPPKGAEFGKTEVFYLTVRDADRARATALNEALSRQLQKRFQELLDAKAQSMIAELVKTVKLAKADQTESTKHLAETETLVGGDLAELRAMQDLATGDSALRRSREETRSQLREARTAAEDLGELLSVLRTAQGDPGRLVATPNRLLESQPALRRLKDGLVDAQLVTATLKGSMSAEHPRVRAARQAETEIAQNLHAELAVAIRGLQVELKMNADRQALLEEQLARAEARLARLAEIRAVYESQAAENRHRTLLVERAEQNLAEARAAQAGAKAASLVSLIDAPDAGSKPIGPSRAVIAASGTAGGLIAGLGLFFFLLPAKFPADSEDFPIREISESTPAKTAPRGSLAAATYGRGSTFRRALEKLQGNGRK
jgi:succinoglycan biosynthesis transport protein ExoP